MSNLNLMIGDWVMKYGKPTKVTPNALIAYYTLPVVNKSIQPIPLTFEILEKIGFKNNEYNLGNNVIVSFGDHIGIRGMLGMVKPQNDIIHLHTLQQLIRLFTGKEIEIEWEK